MAKVFMTIIVNFRLHLSVCGSLIARDWTRFTFTILLFELQFVNPPLQYRKKKTALQSTKKK